MKKMLLPNIIKLHTKTTVFLRCLVFFNFAKSNLLSSTVDEAGSAKKSRGGKMFSRSRCHRAPHHSSSWLHEFTALRNRQSFNSQVRICSTCVRLFLPV